MKKDRKHIETSDQHKLLHRSGKSRDPRSVIPIHQRIKQFVGRQGRRPRILVSSMGKKMYDQQTKLLAAFLAETGFDVDISPLRQTPQGTARMAIENDVHIICFFSHRNMHKRLVTDLARVLKAEDVENIGIVIGGAIPRSDYDFLKDAGVDLILNSEAVDAVSINRLLDLCEQMRNDS
jgi:methylmalonyl-CoA mutase